MPGDVELLEISEFTAGTEATEEFKSKLLSRIDEIIAMESSMEQGTDQ